MSAKLIFCNVPYSLTDVPLSSLVINLRHPNMDNLAVVDLKPDIDYSCRPQQDFKGLLESETTISFGAQITRLLKFNQKNSKTGHIDLAAKEGKIYELKSPKELFKKLCTETQVQQTLAEGVSLKQDTYFVVGWRTFTDSEVGTTNKASQTTEVEGTAPVEEVVKANTALSIGDAGDVKTTFHKTTNTSGEQSFSMEGEYIYAIEYRKIKANKKDVSASTLEKDATWRMYSDSRETVRHKDGEASPDEPKENQYEDYEAVLEDIGLGNSAEKSPEGEKSKKDALVTETGEKYIFLEGDEDVEDSAEGGDVGFEEDGDVIKAEKSGEEDGSSNVGSLPGKEESGKAVNTTG